MSPEYIFSQKKQTWCMFFLHPTVAMERLSFVNMHTFVINVNKIMSKFNNCSTSHSYDFHGDIENKQK